MHSIKEIDKHMFSKTMIKLGEIRFSNRFLLVLHSRFSSATQVSLCKSNWHIFNVKPYNSGPTPSCLQKSFFSCSNGSQFSGSQKKRHPLLVRYETCK